jgi:hypothetical protein
VRWQRGWSRKGSSRGAQRQWAASPVAAPWSSKRTATIPFDHRNRPSPATLARPFRTIPWLLNPLLPEPALRTQRHWPGSDRSGQTSLYNRQIAQRFEHPPLCSINFDCVWQRRGDTDLRLTFSRRSGGSYEKSKANQSSTCFSCPVRGVRHRAICEIRPRKVATQVGETAQDMAIPNALSRL